MPAPVILVELNEVNFDFVRRYTALGELPTLAALIAGHGITQTTSESRYEHLEPWIQWVTAHTGLTLSEHGAFRLGDIVQRDVPQIWEVLERGGLNVAALSPINAANRCEHAAFFVPDPWTPTPASGPRLVNALHAALRQVVGENARGRVSAKSALVLLLALIRYGSLAALPKRTLFAARMLRPAWKRAIFLDTMLAEIFVSQWRATRPDFASMFLNAAAHIQHHYLFSSRVYQGVHRNPAWYVKPGTDPVYEVYAAYDRVVAMLQRRCPDARMVIATGLHQDPCPDPIYYYRLKDHAAFLRRAGVTFDQVLPLMSRDFTVLCSSPQSALAAARRLQSIRAPDGEALFTVDPREASIFCELTYPREISTPFNIRVPGGPGWDMSADVAFVALKNGIHNGIGFMIDSADSPGTERSIPLTDLFHILTGALLSSRAGHSALDAPALSAA